MQRFFEKIRYYATSPEMLKIEFVRPFRSFFRREASSSILLIISAAAAFLWANSGAASTYHHFWETDVVLSFGPLQIVRSLRDWIDEGLMSVFFFTVGLEIKREILVGELATAKKALLPVGAALGGMLFPALILGVMNFGLPTASGWGIPMATDIAFALGALFVFGKRIPLGLRVFLSALAIADDLGAVVVIALFYTKEISGNYLLIALCMVALIALANYFWIRLTLVYAVLGIALWLAMLGSGLHATIAGVVVALFIPARGKCDTDRFLKEVGHYLGEFNCPPEGCGYSILLNQKHLNSVQSIEIACHDVETPLQRLEHALHPWVAFFIVPLFALANGGLTLEDVDIPRAMMSPLTIGIVSGLLIGKPLGITFFSFLFVKTRVASLPRGVGWPEIVAAGILGGLGFTMSLFISGLSFAEQDYLNFAKLGIFIGSLLSGTLGLAVLYAVSGRRKITKEVPDQ